MKGVSQSIERKGQRGYLLKFIIIMVVLFAVSTTLLILFNKCPLRNASEGALHFLKGTLFGAPISYLSIFLIRAVEINKKALCFSFGMALLIIYLILVKPDLNYSDTIQVLGIIIGAILGLDLFRRTCKMHFDFALIQSFILLFMGMIVFSLCVADSENRGALAISGTSLIVSALAFIISSSDSKKQIHIMRLQHYEQHFYECRKSIQSIVEDNFLLMACAINAKNRKKCRTRLRMKVEKRLLRPIAQHLLLLDTYGVAEKQDRLFMFEEENQNNFLNLRDDEGLFFQHSLAATLDETIVDVISFFIIDSVSLLDNEITVLKAHFQKASA